MGVDCEIYFERIADVEFSRSLPAGFDVEECDSGCAGPVGATHQVKTYSRYYGDGYERGDWCSICSVLMLLHECEGIGRVWYGGDSGGDVPECTVDDVLELSNHFMTHGHRPYLAHFK